MVELISQRFKDRHNLNIYPNITQRDYEAALKEIEHLLNAKPDTKDGDKLDILTTLVQAYENEHYPTNFPVAIDSLQYSLKSHVLERKDLEIFIDTHARVSEILNRKQQFTSSMICNYTMAFTFQQNYQLEKAEASAMEN